MVIQQGFPDTSGGPYLFDASFSSALGSFFFRKYREISKEFIPVIR
jgi:hypothetical protein